MNYEDRVESAKEAVNYFNTEMKKLFPNAATAKAWFSDNIAACIYFSFAYDSYAVTIHNAKTYISCNMFLGNPAKPVDYDKVEIELRHRNWELRNAGLKFRKISASSPMEATKKLVAWFEKNKEIIEKTGGI